jgi:Zn-dependent protease with chaperone function
MGTYRICASKEQLLEHIQDFCDEENLGLPLVEHLPDGAVRVKAPEDPTWDKMRCSWTCHAHETSLVLSVQARFSLPKTVGIYAAFALVAISATWAGLLFLIHGFSAWDAVISPIALFVVGFSLFTRLRYREAVLEITQLELRFVNRLTSCSVRVEHPPAWRHFPLIIQVGLVILPVFILVAGVTRALPLIALPTLPWVLMMCFRTISEFGARDSPFISWRLFLSEWVSARGLLYSFSFLAVALFIGVGSVVVILQEEESLRPQAFVATLQLQEFHCSDENISSDILTATAVSFGHMLDGLEKSNPENSRAKSLVSAQLSRAALAGLCLTLFAWGAKGLWDWAKQWTSARPSPKPNLSPPSSRTMRSSIPRIARASLLLSLVLAVIGNLVQLALTVEVISVLCYRQPVFSRPVAQAVAWMVIDLEAAAAGKAQMNPYGEVFVIALILPAFLTLTAWALLPVRGLLGALWRVLTASSEPVLQGTARRFSSTLGIQPPTVRITRSSSPRVETRIPWLWERPKILVTRGAMKTLADSDLTAALAHELGHVKFDLGALRWTRWLSLISFFPCNVFAILLDMERREARADATAAALVGNATTVAEALIKTSLQGILPAVALSANTEATAPQDTTMARSNFFHGIWLLSLLFQPDLIHGYTHPRLQDRLETLDRGQGSQREVT